MLHVNLTKPIKNITPLIITLTHKAHRSSNERKPQLASSVQLVLVVSSLSQNQVSLNRIVRRNGSVRIQKPTLGILTVEKIKIDFRVNTEHTWILSRVTNESLGLLTQSHTISDTFLTFFQFSRIFLLRLNQTGINQSFLHNLVDTSLLLTRAVLLHSLIVNHLSLSPMRR